MSVLVSVCLLHCLAAFLDNLFVPTIGFGSMRQVNFCAIHLSPGRSYVQTTLDAKGNISLGNTFQLLMHPVVFFERCRNQQ